MKKVEKLCRNFEQKRKEKRENYGEIGREEFLRCLN